MHKKSPDGSGFEGRRRSSDNRSSRDERRKREKDYHRNDSKQRKSEVESELEAFAKQHDPEALLERLKQKKMDQIKNSLLEKMAGKKNNIEENNTENPLAIKMEVGDDSNGDESDEGDDSPATSDETIEDIYPWYIGAPLQNQIHDAVFCADDEQLYRFDGRPQKQEEDDLYRSFPLKKRELVSEKVVESDFPIQTKKIPTNVSFGFCRSK